MDNKKVTYEKANAEIVYFENDDVITTSGGGSGSGGGPTYQGCYRVWY